MSTPRIWLITGTSSGFGLELAKIVASKGDRVIATSRSPKPDGPLANIPGINIAQLDQNQPLDQIKAAIAAIVDKYGVPDIVFNNAAYIQNAILEEVSPEVTLRQYQANVFGPLNVYRAILPYLRTRRSGTLVTNGSMASWQPMPGGSLYTSSKAALRNLTLGLATEIECFGIKHMLVEPGFFRTSLLSPGSRGTAYDHGAGQGLQIHEYDTMKEGAEAGISAYDGVQQGDPIRGGEVLFEVITSTGRAEGRQLPAWMPLGADACMVIQKAAEDAIKGVKEWEALAGQTAFPG